MKFLPGFVLAGAMLPALMVQAQVAPTNPQNKNFLIERGTGHVCGSCPHITLRCDSVIDTYPGRGMLIEYHFGPDARPQLGGLETDYRTAYGDSILSWPFYLNMMMNRRDQGPPYGSTFIFGTNDNQIKKEADLIVTQPSQVNMAMSSTFNSSTRLLTVNVDVYYTASSAKAINYIQVAITEDSLISMQYDGDYVPNNHFNPNFVHMNVFRDNMNGFWGDPVNTTTAGTRITRTYTYTLPTAPYKWKPEHCNLTLYVAEERNASGQQSFAGKIISALRAPVGGSNVTTAVADAEAKEHFTVYPNPAAGRLFVARAQGGDCQVEVTNTIGQSVYKADISEPETTLDLGGADDGIYFIRIASARGVATQKILLKH